ncbi:MAG: metallophosphoesterase [Planctomycetota bacterium]|nr:metallophosphoesterase [Planctomycetota bacterium]
MSERMIDRRALLAGGVAGAMAGPGLVASAMGTGVLRPERDAVRKRVLRVAHITDPHVNAEKGSDRGLAQCLAHIQSQADRVDLIANTGDTVMCVNAVDEASAAHQWNTVRAVFKDCSLPMLHCIGNHDLWGWKPDGSDPRRATGWALDALGMPSRYFHDTRFDRSGWSFISLDGICGSYTGKLDDEQFAFLERTLAALPADRFVCILTHIPIISACGFFDGERFKNGQWTMPGSWMHEDAARLKDLFAKHRNVKLCLSGHMHQLDRIEFQGVTYLCSGAVSASWWGGKYYDCDYGYSIIDLFDDGSLSYAYTTYGWKTV